MTKNARVKLARIKTAVMDGIPPTAVFCVIGSAVATAKAVIRGIFDGGLKCTMEVL